jgi:hypothetical protein
VTKNGSPDQVIALFSVELIAMQSMQRPTLPGIDNASLRDFVLTEIFDKHEMYTSDRRWLWE